MRKRIVHTILLLLVFMMTSCTVKPSSSLPLPEVSEGVRGDLGIDKNINESTIDNYLDREDAIYRDVRMLVDPANYEAIGGNSVTDGIIKGFEIVPYPYLCNVVGLPEEVGDSHTGKTLFTKTENGYEENYDESLLLLENMFPKDKTIFLMCGGGGYAGMTKELLVNYGWDQNKIYNVGGYWYYEGNNKIEIKKELNGESYYDMSEVIYHNIDFDYLTAKEEYQPIVDTTQAISFSEINKDNFNEITQDNEYTLIFVYLNGCSACKSFMKIIYDVKLYNDIKVYQVEYKNLSSLNLGIDNLKYAPSLIVLKNGQVVDYLDSSKDEDKKYYIEAQSLSKWLSSNMEGINMVVTNSINNEECTDTTCELQPE